MLVDIRSGKQPPLYAWSHPHQQEWREGHKSNAVAGPPVQAHFESFRRDEQVIRDQGQNSKDSAERCPDEKDCGVASNITQAPELGVDAPSPTKQRQAAEGSEVNCERAGQATPGKDRPVIIYESCYQAGKAYQQPITQSRRQEKCHCKSDRQIRGWCSLPVLGGCGRAVQKYEAGEEDSSHQKLLAQRSTTPVGDRASATVSRLGRRDRSNKERGTRCCQSTAKVINIGLGRVSIVVHQPAPTSHANTGTFLKTAILCKHSSFATSSTTRAVHTLRCQGISAPPIV